MLFLTRYFGVTGSDAERSLAGEQSVIEEIVEKVLLGDFRKRSCYVRVGMFRWSTRNVNSGSIREVLSCACQTLHGQAVHRSVRRKPPIYASRHLK